MMHDVSVELSQPAVGVRSEKIRPYAIDWRFLPERVLLAKDRFRQKVIHATWHNTTVPRVGQLSRRFVLGYYLNWIKAAQVFFIHVPKTGGTSISWVLYQRNLPHFSAADWREYYPSVYQSLPSFSIVRHPVDRMRSAYYFLRRGGTDVVAADRSEMAAFAHVDTFESFVDYVVDHPYLTHQIGPCRSQHLFFADDTGRVLVNRLFRNEQRRLPQSLCRFLNIKELPTLNAQHYDATRLNPRTVKKIEQLYSSDLIHYESATFHR